MTGSAPPERPLAPPAGNELETLVGFLDHHRATLLWKVEGLSDEDLRRSVVPSGWSLLGLVKHLAIVERWWFRSVFAGEDLGYPWSKEDPDADWRVEPGETSQEILSMYRKECDLSRKAVEGASLDDRARTDFEGSRGPLRNFSLRWIFLHMIEETARHNGHADIARELIDGTTGV